MVGALERHAIAPVTGQLLTGAIAGVAVLGIIIRPWRIAEAVWAIAAAAALVVSGLLPWSAAITGVVRGTDVYEFLTGMMLLAELARQEGLFDWLAARAVTLARGSAARLFGLIYAVGVVVTVFLSNDATAVVLTPAVAAATRAAKVERPLPYLLICAFIANAASFVLPISNPANLVIYGAHLPSLFEWLPRFAIPSLLSIALTFGVLRWTQRAALRLPMALRVPLPPLSNAGRLAALGIVVTSAILMVTSGFGLPLGLPTCIAGAATLAVISLSLRTSPWRFLRGVSWGVIPLVAGLFVLVEAMDRSGVIRWVGDSLRQEAVRSEGSAAGTAGVIVALASNLMNNLPAGLIAGSAVQAAGVPPTVSSAVLVGVDLGPNLSVTGSLATILWLTALRRDGIDMKSWDFFKLGILIMPPALLAALGALLLSGTEASL